MFTFTDDQLLDLDYVHSKFGPRATLDFHLGNRSQYMSFEVYPKTTEQVEDFITSFYTQYNARFGTKF